MPPVIPGGPRFNAAILLTDLEADPLPVAIATEIAKPDAAARLAAASVLLEHGSARAAVGFLAGDPLPPTAGPLLGLTEARALIAAGDFPAGARRLCV